MKKLDIQKAVNMTLAAIRGLEYKDAVLLPLLEGEELVSACKLVGIRQIKRAPLLEMATQTGMSKSEARRLLSNGAILEEEGFLMIGKKGVYVISPV